MSAIDKLEEKSSRLERFFKGHYLNPVRTSTMILKSQLTRAPPAKPLDYVVLTSRLIAENYWGDF